MTIPAPVFEAVTITLNWVQGAAVLTALSIVLGFIYWLITNAVVGPMINMALKVQTNEFREMLNELVTNAVFNEFKEGHVLEHDQIRNDITTLYRRIPRTRR